MCVCVFWFFETFTQGDPVYLHRLTEEPGAHDCLLRLVNGQWRFRNAGEMLSQERSYTVKGMWRAAPELH